MTFLKCVKTHLLYYYLWIIYYKTWWQDVCPWEAPRILFFRNILYVITSLFFRAFKCPDDIYNLQTLIQGKKKISTKINKSRASLIAQWLRICLALQETPVSSPVWEDPTCLRAAKPVHHNYWACALEPACLNYWAQALQIPKPTPRACAPQQEEPPL